MPSQLEFVAAYRVDIVGYTDSTLTIEQQEKKRRALFDCLERSSTYQNMTRSNALLFMKNTGDGFYLIVQNQNAHLLIELARELAHNILQTNLSLDTAQAKSSVVNIRTGIHVGQAFVERDNADALIIDVAGPALNYSERIMNIGSASDVLLTSSAVSTILALTSKYEPSIHYAGKYLIKHGEYLRVWYIHADSFGNDVPPKKNRQPLILRASSLNQKLALSLMTLVMISLIISGQQLFSASYFQNSIDEKALQMMQQSIQHQVEQIWKIQDNNKLAISRQLGVAGTQSNPDISELLDDQSKVTVEDILFAIQDSNEVILSAWVSQPAAGNCKVILYKPFDITSTTTDYSQRDWCIGIQKVSDYLTKTYLATGPNEFVNVLVTRINVGSPAKTVGYFGFQIDWTPILQRIIKESGNNEARLVLVDHVGYIAADCYADRCVDLKTLSKTRTSDGRPEPVVFNLESVADSSMLHRSIILEGVGVSAPHPEILIGWSLHLLIPRAEPSSIVVPLVLFSSAVIGMGLLIFYYICPRYWLDETDELVINNNANRPPKFSYH